MYIGKNNTSKVEKKSKTLKTIKHHYENQNNNPGKIFL